MLLLSASDLIAGAPSQKKQKKAGKIYLQSHLRNVLSDDLSCFHPGTGLPYNQSPTTALVLIFSSPINCRLGNNVRMWAFIGAHLVASPSRENPNIWTAVADQASKPGIAVFISTRSWPSINLVGLNCPLKNESLQNICCRRDTSQYSVVAGRDTHAILYCGYCV